MLYGFLKYVAVGPLLRAIWRPWTEGVDNVPSKGAAILASNHLSFCDSFFMPVMVPRRVTFLAKSEYFTTPGLKGRLSRGFFRGVGQVPVDREDADAAKAALDTGVRILGEGHLLGIYPEGTRSPDGRLLPGQDRRRSDGVGSAGAGHSLRDDQHGYHSADRAACSAFAAPDRGSGSGDRWTSAGTTGSPATGFETVDDRRR